MARTKGSKNKKEEVVEVIVAEVETPKVVIHPLSIDYPNEGLNDIARKINEIIHAIQK